jgi:hypothetical protein
MHFHRRMIPSNIIYKPLAGPAPRSDRALLSVCSSIPNVQIYIPTRIYSKSPIDSILYTRYLVQETVEDANPPETPPKQRYKGINAVQRHAKTQHSCKKGLAKIDGWNRKWRRRKEPNRRKPSESKETSLRTTPP